MIRVGDVNHDIAKRLIQEVAKTGELDYITFIVLVKNRKVAEELVAANVFSFNPTKQTVTFQSRIVEEFVKEYAKNFLM